MSNPPRTHRGNDPGRANFLLEQAGWVREIARSMLRNEEDVRDLTQDVMAEALTSDLPGEGGSLRAWLRTVTRRLAFRRYRRRALEQAFLERERVERSASLDPGSAECADEALRLHEDLVEALRELDPEDRTLLVQRHVDGISPAELAWRAGVSSLVIRKRLSRALTRLRAALGRRLTPDSGRGAQAERARRALLVLSAPRGHHSPAARLAPAASAGLLSSALITMGIQKLSLVAAFVLVLGGVALFRASGAGRMMEPVQPKAEFEAGVAQLELPDGDPAASRVVASVPALQRDALEHEDLVPARASAYVEFRDPNGDVRADAFGAWIDESDELHPLVVGEDGTSPVPAGRAIQLVASAPHSLTIAQRLEALEAGAVETVELRARPRIRMRVTVDGAPPGEHIRFPMNAGGVELAGGIHGMGLRAREALERLGLIQRFAPMETDFRGLIDVEYPAELKWLLLGTPQGFLVSTINGETGPGVTGVVIALPGPGVTTVDLRALPRVCGRMLWDDTGEPYVGDVMGVRTFAGAGPGQAAEQFFEFQTNASGRFSIRMHEGADGRAAVSVGLEALDRAAVPRDRRTFQVDPLAMTQEVGDLRVQRLFSVRVRIMGERGESWVPLVAGITSSAEAARTDRDGIADISLGPEGWIDVLSPQ